jgi:hypothetical protein
MLYYFGRFLHATPFQPSPKSRLGSSAVRAMPS